MYVQHTFAKNGSPTSVFVSTSLLLWLNTPTSLQVSTAQGGMGKRIQLRYACDLRDVVLGDERVIVVFEDSSEIVIPGCRGGN
ncbi:hypothetical protein NM688_g4049 [Phlebia brevispora]|uniref:Uncharacterized protein n=1 Tax=Phlebia brevispora TaxID=194682 RepID=A0ACC1T445_9APHY|nr:hypothetical protein NM688_g4049 [Phlebia brevispora]